MMFVTRARRDTFRAGRLIRLPAGDHVAARRPRRFVPDVRRQVLDRPPRRRNPARSQPEIEAVSLIADCLLDLERRERVTDAQILLLAKAIDALELGAYEAAAPLTGEARLPQRAEALARVDRAHALVQTMALDHLRAKFLRLAGFLDPTRRWD